MSKLTKKNVVDVAPLSDADRKKHGLEMKHSSQEDVADNRDIHSASSHGNSSHSDSWKIGNADSQETAFDWANVQPGPTDQSTASPPSSAEPHWNKTSESNIRVQDELAVLGAKDSGKMGTNGHVTDASKSSESMASTNNSKSAKSGSEKKKRGSAWYNVLSPTYKSRSEDFRRIFKDIPNEERLLVDYSCALQKDILVHGRLYVTQNWICFYANIFRWETVLTIRCKDVTSITKERTARVIPNAIQINTREEKFFFTSFSARDKTYILMFRIWQFALLNQPMEPQEMWQFVHNSYGDELGLTSSDDDYVAPIPEDDGIDHLTDEGGTSGVKLTVESAHKEPHEDSDTNINGDTTHLSVPCVTPPDSFSASPGSDTGLRKRVSAPPNTLHVPTPSSHGTSGDYPTDMGDTTEDDDEEIPCAGHEHQGTTHLNEVFYIPVEKLYEHLFTDSEFFRQFQQRRKTFDINPVPWPEDSEADGSKTRTITYTISLNYSVGPKTSPTTEKQTCLTFTKPGRIYVVDTEVVNAGIPYGENFCVINRYCLTRVTNGKSRLRVTSRVHYKKNVWGLVKNFIEKNANSGLRENYVQMAENLRLASSDQTVAPPPGRKRVKRRPHRGDKSPSLKRASEGHPLALPQTSVMNGGPARTDWNLKFGAESLVRIVCLILLLLVMFNALLFYKLLSLETKANILHHSATEFNDLKNTPRSQEEWTRLLQQQQGLHDAEIERWKQILSSSIKLMDQMKVTLTHLHDSITKRSDDLNG